MLAAVLGIVALVPAALVAPVAAVATDRARKGRVLAASLASRAVLLALLSAGIALDSTAVVLAAACLASMCARVFYPAVAASLPAVSRSREELVAANATVSGIEHVGSVIGPALAGAALVAVPPAAVSATAAVGTLAAALVVAGLAVPRPEPAEADGVGGAPSRHELTAGFAALFGPMATRRLVGVHAVHCLAIGALSVAVLQLALEDLRIGTAGLGVLEGALAVGGITGGVVALARARTHSSDQSVRLGAVLWALPFVAVVALVQPAVAVAALAVAGVGNVLIDVAVYTHVQESTAEGVLARTVAALQSLAVGAVGIGSLVAGVAVTALGGRVTLLGIGCVVLLAASVLVRPRARVVGAVPRPAEAGAH
jgi:hypothetical protein